MMKVLTGLATIALLAVPAAAQPDPAANYPSKPVRIVVNVAPGGGVDTATRMVAARLEQRFGQPFVVENRSGAGGNIGAEYVFGMEPDGYTLMASSPSPLAINQWLYKKLNYDPAGFEPIAMMSRIPNVLLVKPNFPAKTLGEFVDYVKANPGKLNFASQGTGTASHLSGELFMKLSGTKIVHVPYKGTGPALNDIIAGHVDLTFIQLSNAFEMHNSGKARILAAATEKRLDVLPDIPTLKEAGIPVATDTWNAISAPPKTPAAIIAKLNLAINEVLRDPDIRARFRELNTLVGGGTAEETARFVKEERRLWGEAVQAAGLKPE
jgi:tripartite-type tricarboxylate transporter receptor subunit TctC